MNAAATINTTLSLLCPCCKSPTVSHFYSSSASLCDSCVAVLAGEADVVVEPYVAPKRDEEVVEMSFAFAETVEDSESEDSAPRSLPPPASFIEATTTATHDATCSCESCGDATEHKCRRGHRVCKGCVRELDGGCPLCESESVEHGHDEDVLGRAELDELVF